MSRIGKKPILVPNSVTVEIQGPHVSVKGPKGELENKFDPTMSVIQEDKILQVLRANDESKVKALHGLTRSLLANMVTGVSEGFQIVVKIRLEIDEQRDDEEQASSDCQSAKT